MKFLLVEKKEVHHNIPLRRNNLFSDGSYASFSKEGELIYFFGPIEKVEDIASHIVELIYIYDNQDISVSLSEEENHKFAEIRLEKSKDCYFFDVINIKILTERIKKPSTNNLLLSSSSADYHSLAINYSDNEIFYKEIVDKFKKAIFGHNQL